MGLKVEKKREFLINLAFLAAIAGIAFLFFKYLFWVLMPFLASFAIAIILQRPLKWLDKKTSKKLHTFWSIVLVIVALIVIFGPIALILSTVIDVVIDFVKHIFAELNDLPKFMASLETKVLNMIKFLPDNLYQSASESIKETFNSILEGNAEGKGLNIDMSTVKDAVKTAVSGVFAVVKNIPSLLIGLIITIISLILLTKDYNHIVGFIKKQLPKKHKNALHEMKSVVRNTVVTLFKAYGLIMCITFLELFLGFSILTLIGIMHNEYFILIAVGTAIFDILPVAGSGGVLGPWALIELVTGNYQLAIGLVILYIVISVIRQYIEPKIVGTSLGVHPIVTLMGLYVGLKLFGFMGMLIVPLSVMTLKALNDNGRIHIWKSDEEYKVLIEEEKKD